MSEVTKTNFLISGELLQQTLNTLVQLPCHQVFDLVKALTEIKPIEAQPRPVQIVPVAKEEVLPSENAEELE